MYIYSNENNTNIGKYHHDCHKVRSKTKKSQNLSIKFNKVSYVKICALLC